MGRHEDRRVSRREAVVLGLGAAVTALGVGAVVTGAGPFPDDLRRRFEDDGPDGTIPDVPDGVERLETRRSAARGRDVDFYTAVPAGHGEGRGLPVCMVLHGASATAADFEAFGLGRFLTAAVEQGAPPFVLAGATGGRLRWEPSGRDDPQAMVREEVPAWCAERGFDTTRLAAWGWSMGGYGALRLAEADPTLLRAVAAFSPALSEGEPIFADADRLEGTPVGLWCGRQDGLYDSVRAFEEVLPEPKAAGDYQRGRHTRGYWDRITPAAFAFVASSLAD